MFIGAKEYTLAPEFFYFFFTLGPYVLNISRFNPKLYLFYILVSEFKRSKKVPEKFERR